MTAPLAAHRHGPAGDVPLVLIPAFPLDSRLYDDVLVHLEGVPTLVVDAPGFGGSPSPEEVAAAVGWSGGPSLEMVARAVLATLDAEGVDRFVVAGTSIGGYVSMRLAALAPERLAGVGLIDTKADPDPEETRLGRERTASEAEGDAGTDAVAPILDGLISAMSAQQLPALAPDLARWASEASTEGIAYALRGMAARPDSTQDLRALADRGVPALVLRGSEDSRASADDAIVMAEALGTEAMEVQDVGHLAPIEAPQTVGRALRDLYERATTGR